MYRRSSPRSRHRTGSVLLALAAVVLATPALYAQDHMGAHAMGTGTVASLQRWFSIFEVPGLLMAVVLAFLTANALKGGRFGSGMAFIAWGLLVMAVGHLHMQLEHQFGMDLFTRLLGASGGALAWVVALLVTWVLTGIGFFKLYRASTHE